MVKEITEMIGTLIHICLQVPNRVRLRRQSIPEL